MMPSASTRRRLALEALRSGAIASVVMMPFGLAFKALGLRVGHYGPKLGALVFGARPEPLMQGLLLAQHLVIGWLSALPLLLFWLWRTPALIRIRDGLVFGALYYLVVNALMLPWLFHDTYPWQLGLAFVLPSLIVHLVFGLSIALTARAFGFLPARSSRANGSWT
jgi:hypothetical protein